VFGTTSYVSLYNNHPPLLGSMGHTMSSAGGFCTGSTVMCEHQRINSTSFVFSAALPALLATAATETIDTFIRYPEMFTALQENVRAVRAVLGSVESLEMLSHPVSPIVHLAIKYPSAMTLSPHVGSSHVKSRGSNAASILTRDPPSFDVAKEEALLQDVVDEALIQGVLITRAKRLYGDSDEKQVSSASFAGNLSLIIYLQPLGQEWHPIRPTIRLAISSALSKKECEKAATIVKSTWIKCIAKKL